MATTQIIKDGVTKDIHDHRLPSTLGTAGQALMMNSSGDAIGWGSAGGSTLYRHVISITAIYGTSLKFYGTLEIINNSISVINNASLLYAEVGNNNIPCNGVFCITGTNEGGTAVRFIPSNDGFNVSYMEKYDTWTSRSINSAYTITMTDMVTQIS